MRAPITRRGALAVLAAGGLAGCVGGKTSASNSSDAGAPASVAATTAARDTTVKLTVWSYVEAKVTPWVARSIKAFKALYPNVTITYTYVPYASMAAKLLGTAVSGGTPDGIFYNPSDAAYVAQSGVLADMTPFWNQYSGRAQFPNAVVWRDSGKVVSVQGYVNTTALWYNKTILDAVGVAVPKTVADLNTALVKVSKAGYGGLTMCAAPTAESEFQILPWFLGAGQNYGRWEKKQVEGVFSMFSSWINAGYIPRDVTGWTQGDAFDKFSGGKFAFTQNGNWNLTAAKTTLKFKWDVAPLPAGSAGSHSIGGGEGFSIGSKSKNASVMWEFWQNAMLAKQAELAILTDSGSIPARQDLASDPALASDPNLKVYANVVKNMGARPSTPKISQYLIDTGKIWNALAGGQTSPAQAAAQLIAQTSAV